MISRMKEDDIPPITKKNGRSERRKRMFEGEWVFDASGILFLLNRRRHRLLNGIKFPTKPFCREA